jgi:DNA-binding MarR family transcriptional regulator
MSGQGVGADRQVAELILQLGRAAYGDSAVGGLTQAQWMALRFFARANRFSRTISAFAEFHATTRGTASQTVKSLVHQGYLTRTRSERDGRSTRFDLTARSLRKLAQDPIQTVVRAAGKMPPAEQTQTVLSLKQLARAVAEERGRPLVGVCALCGHLRKAEGGYQCGLLREALDDRELDELCVRFLPSKRGGRSRRVPGLDGKG